MAASGTDDQAAGRQDPDRPLPSRSVPAIDPSAPLTAGLQPSPEELAEQRARPAPPPSRRLVLGTAGFAVLAAGAGVGYSFWRTGHPADHPPPLALAQAWHDERALLAYLDQVINTAAASRRHSILVQVRRDHAMHMTALEAALKTYSMSHSRLTSRAPASSFDLAGALAAERGAATRAARQAVALDGENAVLLASISACEATHVELLR